MGWKGDEWVGEAAGLGVQGEDGLVTGMPEGLYLCVEMSGG